VNLADITPIILTFNEEANLREAIRGVAWAERILIVDSFSTDATLDIAGEFPQVEIIKRSFDHFANQCNFGLQQVKTKWVLSLDADYKCDADFRAELEGLDGAFHGYQANFRYCIFGHALRVSLYPPRTVLYRRDSASYERDGHAHRVVISGSVGDLRVQILHDDRKPLSKWLAAQSEYANLEAEKLLSLPIHQLDWKDRIRKMVLPAPVLTGIYCLFVKFLFLDGWRGFYYTLQRVYAEMLLSLALLDRELRWRPARRNTPVGAAKLRKYE
jgi:glycosyltransferase involved in cell wall biosynthesis